METHDQPVGGGGGGEAAGGDSRYRIRDTGDELNAEQRETKAPLCRLVQQVLLLDDAELLARVMPFVRCLNNFVLDKEYLLTRKTVAYRASRMSRAQATGIDVGCKYRIGMYVATATRRGKGNLSLPRRIKPSPLYVV